MLWIDRYLSELSSEELKWNEHYLTLISSPTGSGKTYRMFEEAALFNNQNYIICFPYVTQCQAYKDEPNFQFLYDNKSFDPKGSQNIVCTYDQLVKLSRKEDLSKHILFLDEIHNLFTAASYRGRVMWNISYAIENKLFNRVVGFSATFNTKLLSNLNFENIQKIEYKNKQKENITIAHLEDKSITVNDGILRFFDDSFEQLKGKRLAIFRNSKAENVALANNLKKRGYNVLVVDADKRDGDAVQRFISEERLGEVNCLLTTSLLTEGINILDNVDQIHFADKLKSSVTIRQFASRPRNNKAETIVWFGSKNTIKNPKNYEDEWSSFISQKEKATVGLNQYIELFPKRIRKSHISTLIKTNSSLCDGWMKNGFRYYNDEIVLDHTGIANYFHELNVRKESTNLEFLKSNLEDFGFHVYFINICKSLENEKISNENKKELQRVAYSRKKERSSVLERLSNDDYDIRSRRRELLNLPKRTERQNRELQIITKWMALEKKGKVKSSIKILLKNGADDRAIKRNIEKQALISSELREQLSYLIVVGQKYDADERSDLLNQAEKNMKSNKSNQLNINRLADGTINGKTSKRIFSDLFNIRSHVYCGKHSISVTEL